MNNPSDTAQELIEKAANTAEALVSDAALRAAEILKKAAEIVQTNNTVSIDIGYIKRDVSEIKNKLESHYVTKDTFLPIQRIVYGLVSVLGLATLAAIGKLIFK